MELIQPSSNSIIPMEITFLQTLLIFTIILFTYFFYILNPSKPNPNAKFGFKNYPLLGTLPQFILHRHRFLDWSTDILAKCPTNTAIFTRPGNINGVITANPANVEYMLKTNFENFPKGTKFISLLEDFLGRGIFNSDGEQWLAQRKTASYEFNTKSLRNFVMETAAVVLHTRFIPALEKAADMNQVVDFQELLERYSFDNICQVAFNVDPGCLSGDRTSGSEFMKAFDEAATLSSGRFMYVLPGFYKIKKIFNFGSESKLKTSISTVHKFADDIIKSRMENKDEKAEDLLSRFMGNSDYSPEFLRDIVVSFILAGRDTTSSALSWFFWILSFHSEVKDKILNELRTIRQSSNNTCRDFYSFDELRKMNYLHAAISEGLRLYPPVPVDTKACLKEDIMPDGTLIGKGWFVTYHTYAMGRMESVWGKDCREFKPERWLEPDESGGGDLVYKQENSFKYPVFHGGPRICLGKEMAYTQMKLVAATIMEMFELEVMVATTEKSPPEHVLSLTMRMKDGLKVKVKKR